ncbi:MAG: DUF6434 domain-containing protein [Pseudomonadota bacterium]
MQTRPRIETVSSGRELKRWYWRKEDLVAHARALGLSPSGAKFDILDRIAQFLDTGDVVAPKPASGKPKSKFDWHKAPLTPETVITDSYRNTQNVRRFFKAQCEPGFKFNIAFMDWMKGNVGKTLSDACEAYWTIKTESTKPGHQTEIRAHNQFNQYTRDFLADNPDLGLKDVRRFWALKIQQPSEDGRHVYNRADLDLGAKPSRPGR